LATRQWSGGDDTASGWPGPWWHLGRPLQRLHGGAFMCATETWSGATV